jgi:hypothetical protein
MRGDPLLFSSVVDALNTPAMTARLETMIDRAIVDVAADLGIPRAEVFARACRWARSAA